jgi:hypothetical protein
MNNPAANAAAFAAQSPPELDPVSKQIQEWDKEAKPTVRPPRSFARTTAEILCELSKPIAPQHVETFKKGNTTIPFLNWKIAIKYLDFRAPGWCSEIRSVHWIQERIVIVMRISIPTAEGWIFREATGTEEDDTDGKMYGTPADHAEAAALKRAAAKFGLALNLKK